MSDESKSNDKLRLPVGVAVAVSVGNKTHPSDKVRRDNHRVRSNIDQRTDLL